MNINTGNYIDRFAVDIAASEGGARAQGSGLDDDIEEHHHVLTGTGKWVMTGEVALISDPSPDMAGTGALQVWSKTAEGVWVWIDTEGVAIEAACPFGD